MKVTKDVENILKHYVYVYVDPRNKKPFYIGMGKGGRLLFHLKDKSEKEKVRRIAEIRSDGKEPQIILLRYGLTETEASLVEAASIDLIGKMNLTNLKSGHHEKSFGRIDSEDIFSILMPKSVKVKHKALLITINKLYRSDMTKEELYEATRGIWALGDDREEAEYAMSVFQGVVREVYKIERWHPAGTLKYNTRDSSAFKGSGRWEFEGKVATGIRDTYLRRFVGKSGQFPVRYLNIKKK